MGLPPAIEDPARLHELGRLVESVLPGARLVAARPLGADADAAGLTKGGGYGLPLLLEVDDASGRRARLVLHFARADEFGHDRRSDRAQEMLLAWDTFGAIPRHARALDVGAVIGGRLRSLRDAGEFWLLSAWAPGEEYAHDLRRIAATGVVEPRDLARVDALADYLSALHRERPAAPPAAYRRALRDLVGSGEGVFGIVDAYGDAVPAAPPDRLARIEAACVAWRHRLAPRHDRLRRTHGDFHPFNVLFDGDALHLLDASRGGLGDPADDVTCMAINYPFFALGDGAHAAALRTLWRRFWDRALAGGDPGLLEAAPPFLAWRGLVLACPRWYPDVPAAARDRLLALVERALAAPAFDPAMADEVFAAAESG